LIFDRTHTYSGGDLNVTNGQMGCARVLSALMPSHQLLHEAIIGENDGLWDMKWDAVKLPFKPRKAVSDVFLEDVKERIT
jgi:hypothetical protein